MTRDAALYRCGRDLSCRTPALARNDEHFDVDTLAEGGRGLRLILRAVDYFNVETGAGENVTTLIKRCLIPA